MNRSGKSSEQLDQALAWVPNLPHESVPVGLDESANVVVREWGTISKPGFAVLPHWEIGAKLGILDLEASARVSGSGFYILKGAGARLQRALIAFMLDTHAADGFTEIVAPHPGHRRHHVWHRSTAETRR